MFISKFTIENYVKPFIKAHLRNDPFVNTIFRGYIFLSVTGKGSFGETLLRQYFDELGAIISGALSAGHDLIINGIRSEVKITLSKNKKYTINHMSVFKDWEEAYFIVGNPLIEVGCYKMTKESFIECLKNEDWFARQQGGNNGNNDDYICSQKKVVNLINSRYVTKIDSWVNEPVAKSHIFTAYTRSDIQKRYRARKAINKVLATGTF
jgi:hypothetical protein